jgi:general secretion pathway protein C
MSSRWTGFFIWALVAASAAFWGIRIFAATRPVPPGAQAPETVAANGPMERLFGAIVVAAVPVAAVHPESERFQLVGVIAPPGAGGAHGGYAVVAIDGQPARSWQVGATLDGNTALLSVSKRGADFGPRGGPAAFSLQLPEPTAAETGTLPPATSQPVVAQAPQFAPQPNMPGGPSQGAPGGPMQQPQGGQLPQNGASLAHTVEPSDDGESNEGRRRQR